MKSNQKGQESQGTQAGNKQTQINRGGGSSHSTRKNEDISTADRAEEPTPNPSPNPMPNPAPSPDLPPRPSRREFDDPGHEHEHRNPSSNDARKHLSGYIGE